MTKKIIGIPAWNLNGEGFGAGIKHYQFIEQFGNPRIITPCDPFFPDVDMIYLPGGADLSPSSYGEAPKSVTSNTDVIKQYFYDHHLKNYIEAGKAVFGVCLGFQMLATYFNSTLVQHFRYHPTSRARTELIHRVYPYSLLDRNGKLPTEELEEIVPIDFDDDEDEEEIQFNIESRSDGSFGVNSFHHQGIVLEKLGSDLEPLLLAHNEDAYLTREGHIVEAFKHKTLPIAGVQSHLEETYCKWSVNLFKEMLG